MSKTKQKKTTQTTEIQKKSQGIFDFDEELKPPTRKVTATRKKVDEQKEDYIGVEEVKPINKNKLKKIKKQKTKEKKAKDKELAKVQKNQEKVRKQTAKIKKKASLTPDDIKRKAIRKTALKVIMLIIAIACIMVFIMLSPLFNLQTINVEGIATISKEQALSLSGLEIGTNLFNLSKSQIKENIKENPYVKNVEITRTWPDTITITVEERTATFMLEYGSAYAYIDNQGYILEISANTKEGLPKIRGYETENIVAGNRLNSVDLEKLSTVLKIMTIAKNNEIDSLITTIDITDDSEYTLYLESEGKTVYLGDNSNLDTKMLYVKAILEKEADYEGEIFVNVDLNEDYPYFRENV